MAGPWLVGGTGLVDSPQGQLCRFSFSNLEDTGFVNGELGG